MATAGGARAMLGSRMADHPEEVPASLEQTQAALRESLDNARKLVEQAKFMFRGDSDESAA